MALLPGAEDDAVDIVERILRFNTWCGSTGAYYAYYW